MEIGGCIADTMVRAMAKLRADISVIRIAGLVGSSAPVESDAALKMRLLRSGNQPPVGYHRLEATFWVRIDASALSIACRLLRASRTVDASVIVRCIVTGAWAQADSRMTVLSRADLDTTRGATSTTGCSGVVVAI